MRGLVLVERARRHYEERGFLVLASEPGDRADFVVEKAGRQRLVRVDDEPLGTYQIGALAAQAKRARVGATVICPATADVIEACDQFGVEHLSLVGLAEETLETAAALPIRVPRPATEPAVTATAVTRESPAQDEDRVPAWRWSIVALIWLAACATWVWLLLRVF